MIFILIMVNIILLVIGQTLWKIGVSGDRLSFNADSILKLISSPYIISGIILYSLATVIWLYILSKE
ncbi:MAG: hypothetical protein Q8936_21055, partial [Bacillota bacterium]|nr:hypothetical protein [Bacillota bacterium]